MCEVRIKRDASVPRGTASWFELADEMLLVVSEHDVTSDGAESLERGWGYFIDRGVWRWKTPGGRRIDAVYARVVLPEGLAVRITSSPGLVGCHLSPDHFTQGAAVAIQRAARECIRRGWTWHEPFLVPGESLVGREVA